MKPLEKQIAIMEIYQKHLISGTIIEVSENEFVDNLNSPYNAYFDRNIYRNKKQSLDFLKKHKIIKNTNLIFSNSLELLIKETNPTINYLNIINSNCNK